MSRTGGGGGGGISGNGGQNPDTPSGGGGGGGGGAKGGGGKSTILADGTNGGGGGGTVFSGSDGRSTPDDGGSGGYLCGGGGGGFNSNGHNGGCSGGGGGGAIFSYYGPTDIEDCTISGNQATGSGGGVVVVGVYYPHILTLNNTIIANNGANECSVIGYPFTGVGNLIMQNGSGSACPGVVTNVDPQLQALQPASTNGGLTPTMAIPLYSSAMGVADAGTSIAYDQRYANRPQPDKSPRNGYDIGAFEVCRRFVGPSLEAGPCGYTIINPPTTTLTMQV